MLKLKHISTITEDLTTF